MTKVNIFKDNKTNRNKVFEKLCVKTQKEMKSYLTEVMKSTPSEKGDVTVGDGFVYREGTFPVLLISHMDTVHKNIPTSFIYANGSLSSPQGIGGDDRCGIYMIRKVLKKFDCHVAFLEDEEIGCVGAKKFVKSKTFSKLKECGIKFIIEFDRHGNNDAVFYDCDNEKFTEFVTKEFFEENHGTCSDISYIAPALGVAAVNLSCGYHNEHHLYEKVVLKEMETVIKEACKLLERSKEVETPFEYIKATFNYNRFYNGYGYNYGYGYGSTTEYIFEYTDECGVNKFDIIEASSKAEAHYMFFKNNPSVAYKDIVEFSIC